MWGFEKRPSDLVRIQRAIFAGVAIAVPLLFVAPRVFVKMAPLRSGSHSEPGVILEMENGVATVQRADGSTETGPWRDLLNEYGVVSHHE